MKKKIKTIFIAAAAAGIAMMSSMTCFAYGWQYDEKGKWYGTNEDNSTWYVDEMVRIDTDGDGLNELYYFGSDGYAKTNSPYDWGYFFNADGAYCSPDGTVLQSKPEKKASPEEVLQTHLNAPIEDNYNKDGVSNVALDMLDRLRHENDALYGIVDESRGYRVYDNGFAVKYHCEFDENPSASQDDYGSYGVSKVYTFKPSRMIKGFDDSITDIDEALAHIKSLGFTDAKIIDSDILFMYPLCNIEWNCVDRNGGISTSCITINDTALASEKKFNGLVCNDTLDGVSPKMLAAFLDRYGSADYEGTLDDYVKEYGVAWPYIGKYGSAK